MIFTLWEHEDYSLSLVDGERPPQWPAGESGGPVHLLHRIEADSWEDACAERNRLMGWEPYKPMDGEPTP